MPPAVLETFTPRELLSIVCQYAAKAAKSKNITNYESLTDETIMGYVNAAVAWTKCTTYKDVPLYTN
jgi:hypothetical protein